MARRGKRIYSSKQNLKVTQYQDKPVIPRYGEAIVQSGFGTAKQPFLQYGATLVDPWSYHSTRVPDLSCFQTGTYTVQKEFLWTATAGSGVATNNTILIVEASANPYVGYLQGPLGLSVGAASTASARSVMVSGTLSTRFSSARMVASGVQVRFADNDSSSSGQITGSYLPAWRQSIPTPSTSTYATWAANPSSSRSFYSGPLRDGVRVTSRPLDALSYEMFDVSGNNASFGTFLIAIEGLTAGQSRLLNVSIVMHYEGLVADNTYGEIDMAQEIDTNAQLFGVQLGAQVANTCSATPESIAEINNAIQQAITGGSPGRPMKKPKLK